MRVGYRAARIVGRVVPAASYVEIWNDVFMEYEKKADGTWGRLVQQTVDTGMGLSPRF